MGYVFISYSSTNVELADSVRELFKRHSINTWMAPYDIPAGSEYAFEIGEALKNCSCLVLISTDAAQNSRWVRKELERAICHGKVIIPMQFEDIEMNSAMEFYLADFQAIPINKISDDSEEIKKVLTQVKENMFPVEEEMNDQEFTEKKFDEFNKAADKFFAEITNAMSSFEAKSESDSVNFFNSTLAALSELNESTEGICSELQQCIELMLLLNDIAENGSYELLPKHEKIMECIDYLKDNQYSEMLASIYASVAEIYDSITNKNKNNSINEMIGRFYVLAIDKYYELAKSNAELYYREFGRVLSLASVFIDRTKSDIVIKFPFIDPVSFVWQCAMDKKNYELAENISHNYYFIYGKLGEFDSTKAAGLMLEITHREIFDAGLEYDLKKFIGDSQGYANLFRDAPGNNDSEIAKGYLNAAYFAEHSDKESASYRNKEIALNYYWYCAFAEQDVFSIYAEKAYNAALKVPFSKDCRCIAREIRTKRKN